MGTWDPRANDLFLQALELRSAAERDQFLEGACAGDAALRAEVEALLEAGAQAGSFLESPATAPQLAATVIEPPVTEGPGTDIGPYRLLEQIGEGGFGIVFMAEQTQPVRRKVALKVLKPGMDTRQVVARFEAERQALAIMDHPNIAKVHDGGVTASGRPYFVMELVKGVPMTDFCDQNHLTPRQRLELFVPVCQAVQHAHQKGIIHRDLKPSNILVTVQDTTPVVKVIDFGVAKALGQELTDKTLFTGFAQMIGTPLYMSPEQAGQSGLDIDTRSDIYSLGVLLYELLTGTTPLERNRFKQAAYDEIRRIIREEEPPRPSARLSALKDTLPSVSAQRQMEPAKLTKLVRGELDWVVMKALEKDRSRRYETANGLALDIQHYLADEPVQACPPSAAYRFRKLVRRNMAAVVTALLVALLLVLGTVVSTYLAIRATDAEELAEQRLVAEKGERERAVRAEREGKRLLVDALLSQARAGRLSRRPGRRFEGLQALAEAARLARELGLGESKFDDLRNEAIACLALADIRPVREWEGAPPESTTGLAFDADLELYARSDLKGNISVRRVADDGQLAVLRGDGSGGGASGAAEIGFNADGTRIAVSYGNAYYGNWWPGGVETKKLFRLWDWRQGKVILQSAYAPGGHAFSPDGRRLALGGPDGTVTLHDTADGKAERQIRVGLVPRHLAFHPNGKQLAVAGSEGRVELRDVATGDLVGEWDVSSAWSPAWHPDGVLVATTSASRNVCLRDPASGQLQATLLGHTARGAIAQFSPGGDMLLSRGLDGTSRLWDPWARQELLCFPGTALQFSRDGQRLISWAGPKLVLWEVAAGHEYRALPRATITSTLDHGGGGFSPDGHWLTVASANGVRLWDVALRKEGAFLPAPGTMDAKFHPSGRELFTCGRHGLYRWPVQAVADGVQIGPPRKLDLPVVRGFPQCISLDRAGRLLALAVSSPGGFILDLDNPPGKIRHLSHHNAFSVAASPDGRWVATGPHNGFGVKVWDAQTGDLVRELIPDERVSRVAFSPDGRWLVTATAGAIGLWEAGSWRLARRLRREQATVGPSSGAFTADGKLLAVVLSPGEVAFIEPGSGRVLVRLQTPDDDQVWPMGFSPDGSQLAVSAEGVVRLWDLRRIREQLRKIGLDWDWPPYPPPARPDGPPLRVDVDSGTGPRPDRAPAVGEKPAPEK